MGGSRSERLRQAQKEELCDAVGFLGVFYGVTGLSTLAFASCLLYARSKDFDENYIGWVQCAQCCRSCAHIVSFANLLSLVSLVCHLYFTNTANTGICGTPNS